MLKKFLSASLIGLYVLGMSVTSYAGSYGWHQDNHGWWFDRGDGTYIVDDAEFIDIDARGDTDNLYHLFLFDEQGYLVTDRAITEDGETFHIDVNGYIYDGNHNLIQENGGESGWNYDGYGWWYRDTYGTYPADGIYYLLSGDHYYSFMFDKDGYLVVNQEVRDDGKVYYADKDGILHNPDGSIFDMENGWHEDDSGWWYKNGDGYLADGIYYIAKYDMPEVYCAFKFDEDGYLVVNQEVRDDGKVYYADEDGYLYDAFGAVQCIWSH